MAISRSATRCPTPTASTPWPASLKSRTPRPRRGFVADGRHLWNSGMFVFTARTLLRGTRTPRPAVLPAVRQSVADRQDRPRFHPAGRRGVQGLPVDQHRLRGGRTHQPRRRRAGRPGLVGRRKLERAVGARRQGRRRQCRAGRRRAGGRGELLCPQRRHARRRRRPEGRRRGGDRGRGAGHAPRPGPGREEDRRAPEGRRPAGSRGPQPHATARGAIREPDPGRPLPGEAHRRHTRAGNCRCKAISIAPNTGSW